MKIGTLRMIVAIFLTVLLIGCATSGGGPATAQGPEVADGQPGADGQPAAGPDDSVSTMPLGQDPALQLDPLNDPDSPLSVRVIYFNFDESGVTPESQETITSHGQYLIDHPQQRIRLEGHTDERGSREYNLGLGEQRAQSVSQLLKLQGVAASQIELISYGEELPAAFGHDEESWRLNRRVELVYIDLK
ncbi:MAG: peptidoglycan-associated lipoprotein Pal [Gammaproteobacteria bacterium]|nr:peptidoglycan-associated lipoprotein Pal [Gammaproteobacteria bacterium]